MDSTSIIFIILSLAMVVALPLCSVYFRKLRKPRPLGNNDGVKQPPVSIVVSAFDDADGVLSKLPTYLEQQYESDFEVILVVNNEKVKEEDYNYQLEQLEHFNKLKVTYVPDSSHYMGHQKLAVTLGVKAAKYDWILLTDAHTIPSGERWLQTMARNCVGKDMVLGYSNLAYAREDFHQYERMLWQLYNLGYAERGIAYSTASGNMMFRKSMFLNGKGYSGNLRWTFGEYEFLVNKYAKDGNVAVETSPEAWCLRVDYNERENDLFHRCFQETRKHMMRSLKHRLWVASDQAVLHLGILLCGFIFVYGLASHRWIPALIALLALSGGMALREMLAQKTMQRFNVKLNTKVVTHFELFLPWQHIIYYIKYLLSDKTEFISHKF